MKFLYTIALRGCDANTYLKISLNNDQVKLIKKLCELSEKNSTYGCEPTMAIKKGEY